MIYFDNASTTKIDEMVKVKLLEAYENFWGNPSSLHSMGFSAEKKIKESRKIISKKLGINDKNIYFVPSGTIANNAVLNSFDIKEKNIVISEVEHASIYYKSLNMKYCQVRYVKVDSHGFIDEMDLLNNIDDNTVLVSIIHVNNEIGTINDINHLAKISKEKNKDLFFHSDGVQAFNKIKTILNNIDFYTISSHKINGPKGTAALYIKKPQQFKPLYFGGKQEQSLFSGTENSQSIMAFAEAVKLENKYSEIEKINRFIRKEVENIRDSQIISPESSCSPYILNIGFESIGGEILLHYLEMENIYISTGSACNKGEKSRVLNAINVSDKYINGCIRVSLSKDSTMEEAEVFVKKLKEKIEEIRRIVR